MSLAERTCCDEYLRTGDQHGADCEYALLGYRASETVRLKAEYAWLLHRHRGVVEALKRYGSHDASCGMVFKDYGEGMGECTCGLDRALAQTVGAAVGAADSRIAPSRRSRARP